MLIKQMCYGCASILIVTSLFLAGCGGGSSTNTAASTAASLKGVAAKGAPLANATITLTDSSVPTAKTVTATTKADGSFSFDVTGLTAPFVLKAVAGTITLYSVQDKAPVVGQSITVNITPITTAIAGVLSTTGKPAGVTPAVVTTTKLTSVKIFIQKSLTPSLTAANVSTTFDPINGDFNADGTGFDSVLDNIQVAQSSTNDVFIVDKNMIKTCPTSPFNPGCYSVSDPGNTTSTNANICGSDIATGAPIPCDPRKPMTESAYNPIAISSGAATLGCTGCVFMGNDDNFTTRATTATTLTVTQVTPAPATTTTTPTTTTPTTTTTPPAAQSTSSGSISAGASAGYTCYVYSGAIQRCSYITSCAANSGNGSGYYQTNLGTYSFTSSTISAAASAAVKACVPTTF
jgi:hypothetical protein